MERGRQGRAVNYSLTQSICFIPDDRLDLVEKLNDFHFSSTRSANFRRIEANVT